LEPGVEGLVHVSELSPKRVWRPSDVVKEGEQVDVLVLSMDVEAQRISLSMKALAAPPEPAKKDEADQGPAKTSKKFSKPTGPLRGGLSRSGGDRFGLKW
jgi:small subunit ribosomal protein S1